MPVSRSPALFNRMTPIGRGAIAVVLVQGDDAVQLVGQLFQSAANRPLKAFPLNRIVFGTWANGEELVVCRTDDQTVEIHCHGGEAAYQAVAKSLEAVGCRCEETNRAVATTAGNKIAQQAWRLLPMAQTERIAGILLNQYRGALSTAIETVIADLKNERIESANERLGKLLERCKVGLHLVKPWRVAIVGETNVGKSSLMNRLVGYERSITFDEPGVTRDLVTADSAIEGWPVRFTDTAGIREQDLASEIETIGMQRSRTELTSADVVVVVLDARYPALKQMSALGEIPDRPIIVLNKSDLAAGRPADAPTGSIAACAISGVGVDQIMSEITQRIGGETTDWLSPVTAVPLLPQHLTSLQSCQQLIADRAFDQAKQTLGFLLRD